MEKMRAFIIKFIYVAIWGGLLYCILKYALPFFMPFVIAFIIAFLLKPLINKITKKTPLNRKAVAIIVLTLLYLVLAALLVLLGARLVIYTGDLFAKLPGYYRQTIEPAFASISVWVEGFAKNIDPSLLSFLDAAGESITNALSSLVTTISSGAVGMVTGIASRVPWFVVTFFLTIVSSYFLVVDYYKVTHFITRQFSEKSRRLLFVIKDYVINVVFKFGRAYAILMLITFTELSVGLLILQVPSPFLIAAAIAIVDILPVLGSGTILIPWAVYSLIFGNWFLGIGLLVLYAVITVVRQLLEPRVIGRQIGLYPLLTLICMFVGAQMFGFWGLFGLPITLTVLLHLNRAGEIKFFKE
ncbi:sporulation integral membrane protein YtvI [Ruminococcaceae bacterium OttesenSCG-928-A16]|nr:sporulation integral membrane protein YtvI [Ruminococcaceae bacterium OttesenSCG-928-A16]